MWRLLILVGVFVGLSSASVVQADEIDDMVETLNQKVLDQDIIGFGESYTKFGKDPRYPDFDYSKGSKQAQAVVKAVEVFGKPLNLSIVKRLSCGNRVENVVAVFFADQGQYVFEYWFFRPQDDWVLSSVHANGHGSGKEFIKKLRGATLDVC